MKKRLFQFALLWHPTDNQSKEGQQTKLLVAPTQLLAKDEKTASILVAKQIPEEYVDQLDQVEILLTSF